MYGKPASYKSLSSSQTVEVKPKKKSADVMAFIKNWFK